MNLIYLFISLNLFNFLLTIKDACSLPRVAGPCEGNYPSWYTTTRLPAPVVSSVMVAAWVTLIVSPVVRNVTNSVSPYLTHILFTADKCEKPQDAGGCQGTFQRWSYDKTSMSCQEFNWGGYQGNENNFLSERKCHLHCRHQSIQRQGFFIFFAPLVAWKEVSFQVSGLKCIECGLGFVKC